MKKLFMVLVLLVFSVCVFAAGEGEGTASIEPVVVLPGETGVYAGLTVTAGATAYSSGFIIMDIPAGWSEPSVTGTDPGYVSAVASEGDDLVIAVELQRVTITVAALTADTGTIEIYYGSVDEGGSGATAQSEAGTAEFTIYTDPDGGGAALEIAAQPTIEVLAATETVTETMTETVTETVTETITETVTPTITATVTQTITPTTTPTPVCGDYTIDNQQQTGRELIYDGKIKLRGITIYSAQVEAVGNTIWVYDVDAITDIDLNTLTAFTQANFRYPVYITSGAANTIWFGGINPKTGTLYFPIFRDGLGIYFDGDNFKGTFHLNLDVDGTRD